MNAFNGILGPEVEEQQNSGENGISRIRKNYRNIFFFLARTNIHIYIGSSEAQNWGELRNYRPNIFLSVKRVYNYDGHHWSPKWGRGFGNPN